MNEFFQPTVNDLKSKAAKAKNSLESLKRTLGLSSGNPWPQTKSTASLGVLGSKTKGFLPPRLYPPISEEGQGGSTEIKKSGEYLYSDWRGQILFPGLGFVDKVSKTEQKFNKSSNLNVTGRDLFKEPYSTRDTYLIFNDVATDYFRHGLQILNNLNANFEKTPDSSGNVATDSRLKSFKTTPYELNDPVIFGFEIIIDDLSSPLLNGSVDDFITKFGSQISEIGSKATVYNEFKNQFSKIFKTRNSLRLPDGFVPQMTPGTDTETLYQNEGIYIPGKKAYMNYYLKKISGLEKLAEGNSPGAFKYLADYRKDTIDLEFAEDVSLTIGTLAHLYKLLYWSKPNGKALIPDNILRFNCDIIVSEVRNFNRVRKALDSNNLEVIKDNVSRYVYSLKECQFYFTSMPHESIVDLGAGSGSPKVYDTYSGLKFDYKYVTTKLERWVPGTGNAGTYVGYDNGALWKIGNPGSRTTGSASTGSQAFSSVPKFFTKGANKWSQNGVENPLVLKKFATDENSAKSANGESKEDVVEKEEKTLKQKGKDALKKFGEASLKRGAEALKKAEDTLVRSVTRELQSQINTRVGLLNAAINKILNAQGLSRIGPPRNIYTDSAQSPGSRVFYDVRGDLLNFLGSGFAGQFAGSNQTIVDNRDVQQTRSTGAGFDNIYTRETTDYSLIQYPDWAQKYPPPVSRK